MSALKPPHFWYSNSFSLLSILLIPISWLFRLGAKIRSIFASPYRASVPVICVGNINLGGGGKTPTVIWLAEQLKARGLKPQIVTLGYGGSLMGPSRVQGHSSLEVGDEALLLQNHAPVWVSKDRKAGVKAAEKDGADVILLDDGLQNPHVVKNCVVLCVDGKRKFGNAHIFPAGPLRESIAEGYKSADAIFHAGSDATWMGQVSALIFSTKARSTQKPTADKYLAFSGIAHPDKFYSSLDSAGFQVVEKQDFPDHYPFTPDDLQKLKQRAQDLNATLITTEKDYVRLSPEDQEHVNCFKIALEVENDEEAVSQILIKCGLGS